MPRPTLLPLAVVAAALAGCAVPAPVTITPASPTGAADVRVESAEVRAETAPRHDDADDGPGSAETRQGRGHKDAVSYDELIGLGEQLTAALESGDVEQWLALTTLTGDAAQQQRDWFAGVQAVPMDVREMHPTWLLQRDVDGEVHGPLVEFSFRHQITGADAVPVVQLYEFTLERVGVDGPYRVVEVGGTDTVDSAYPQLWDLGPITVTETEHTVLIAEQHSDLQGLGAGMDAAAAAVFDSFPVAGVDRMAVSVVDESLVARLFGESEEGTYAGLAVPVSASPTTEAGRNLPDVVTDDSIGARLVVDLDYSVSEWSVYDEPEGGSPLLRHEGLHLAMMLRHPDGEPPRWAVEGFAGWFELSGDPELRQSHEEWYAVLADLADPPETLPPKDYWEFFVEDGDSVERHYLEAANVFLYVEETHGADTTSGLGEGLHTLNVWTDEDEDVARVLQEWVGTDLAGFEEDYVRWVRDTYGS